MNLLNMNPRQRWVHATLLCALVLVRWCVCVCVCVCSTDGVFRPLSHHTRTGFLRVQLCSMHGCCQMEATKFMSLAQACFVRSLPPSLACLVCITPSFPLRATFGFLTPHGTTHTITHKCADSMRRFAMFRYIKRLAMVYLVSQLNATELAEVQLTFQRLNPANPGILVPMELYYAVRQSGHHIKRSEVCARHTCP